MSQGAEAAGFTNDALRPVVLLVEDEPTLRRALRKTLEPGYRCVEAGSVAEATVAVARESVAVIVLDVNLPDGSGIDWLASRSGASEEVVVVSGDDSSHLVELALAYGAFSQFTKPCRPADLRSQIRAALASHDRKVESKRALTLAQDHLTAMTSAMCERLVTATWMRDGETGAHVDRIGDYSRLLAETLDLGAARAAQIGEAARLHDLGKIGVPDQILRKAGPLTDEERLIIQRHSIIGATILGDSPVPEVHLAHVIARSHHERWDGRGYPDRLLGQECALEARIVAIVDVYDALSHARVYKAAWDEARIVAYLADERGRAFEPSLVEAFLSVLPHMARIRTEHRDPPVSAPGSSP